MRSTDTPPIDANVHASVLQMQERLREAHEVARLASWEWQPETGDVLVFQALAEAGMPAETLVPLEEWLAMVPVEEHEWVRGDFDAYRSGEREESIRRFRHTFPTGPVWLEIRSRAVRDADGRLECVRGTAQDVSEQELAEQELKNARDFFQATLDSLSAHLAVLDEDGTIVMTNRAWSEFGEANGAIAGTVAVGANYLAACDGAGDGGEGPARREACGRSRPGVSRSSRSSTPVTARRWRVGFSYVRRATRAQDR